MSKTYELSLSPKYVSNWGLSEAVREILQNAIDAQKSGHKMIVKYFNGANTLCITSCGSSLNSSQLVLGNSSKSNDEESIGQYGEGFKLALLVLLRDGYEPTIYNSGLSWIPKFISSNTYGTQVLAIEEETADIEDKRLVFYIRNITSDEYCSLVEYFPCINDDFGETIECSTGYILKDKRFQGKMFVEGLYIQSDSNFNYGYNFNADVVKLDRDRKAINYWELRKLTAKSLVTGETCDNELVNAIGNSCTDIKDLEDVLDDASDDFLEQYRDLFYEKNNLIDNTLVATNSVMSQLKQLDSTINVIEGTEIQAYLIAKANDKLDLLYKAQDAVEETSDVEKGFDYLISSAYLEIRHWIYAVENNGFDGNAGGTLSELVALVSAYTPSYYSNIKEYVEVEENDWSEEWLTKCKNDTLATLTNINAED